MTSSFNFHSTHSLSYFTSLQTREMEGGDALEFYPNYVITIYSKIKYMKLNLG
jgi:hypothetical protein